MDSKQGRLAEALRQGARSLAEAREWKSAFKLAACTQLLDSFHIQFSRELAKGAATVTEHREIKRIVKGMCALYGKTQGTLGQEDTAQINAFLHELKSYPGDTAKLQEVLRKWGKDSEWANQGNYPPVTKCLKSGKVPETACRKNGERTSSVRGRGGERLLLGKVKDLVIDCPQHSEEVESKSVYRVVEKVPARNLVGTAIVYVEKPSQEPVHLHCVSEEKAATVIQRHYRGKRAKATYQLSRNSANKAIVYRRTLKIDQEYFSAAISKQESALKLAYIKYEDNELHVVALNHNYESLLNNSSPHTIQGVLKLLLIIHQKKDPALHQQPSPPNSEMHSLFSVQFPNYHEYFPSASPVDVPPSELTYPIIHLEKTLSAPLFQVTIFEVEEGFYVSSSQSSQTLSLFLGREVCPASIPSRLQLCQVHNDSFLTLH